MERYICIHAHFYQPPRENPWLEAIELQDSAYPYHDWNKRITSECYAPNSASRILDERGRILDIASNYREISFNFGATLLSWMEKYSPDVYESILEADRQSVDLHSGHGNALAQVYNHMIMPLASSRDKRTQVRWGIADFEHRFKRTAEGMWLAETAVDLDTLNILAEHGIRYTVLAPGQASRVRKIGTGKWKDVSGARIDPARAYLCRLPSGKKIALFFYDGPISQAVAFEKLLNRGEDFANRLLSGFSDARKWPQILHIATDGETYGHHHKYGDMALAYAIDYLKSKGLARLTNYGEYLEKFPPTHEVQIFENSSWSCVHGIERWRSNCGCNSGGHSGWNQEWRGPLRDSLNWLRNQLVFRYENKAKQYVENPWKARDAYIDVLLDRSKERTERFFSEHAKKSLSHDGKVLMLKLLEMQRHAMLMFTSCGWFFDELSGIETVQVLQYAGRAVQLSDEIFEDNLENVFVAKLAAAKSNLPEHENGAGIYRKFVKPAIIDFKKVAAHYAVSSIFEEYPPEAGIFSYSVRREDYRIIEAGKTRFAVGAVLVSSDITWDSESVCFSVLHLGDHAINGGVCAFLGESLYQSMKKEMIKVFEKGAFADIIRLMDKHFGMHNYSLVHMFRDQQRRIVNLIISETIKGFVDTYSSMYNANRILMGFLKEDAGVPVPKAFCAAAELTINAEIKEALSGDRIDVDRLQQLFGELSRWNVATGSMDIEFAARHRLESMMEELYARPSDPDCMTNIRQLLETMRMLPGEVNYWQMQNIYYKMAKSSYKEFLSRSQQGDKEAQRWTAGFEYLGELLHFNVPSILKRIETG